MAELVNSKVRTIDGVSLVLHWACRINLFSPDKIFTAGAAFGNGTDHSEGFTVDIQGTVHYELDQILIAQSANLVHDTALQSIGFESHEAEVA